ncbi:MAG: disulfide bond formation protein DsbA [Proteobacteria bacterium]|nr:MAG: disulfide bond formation protein DsbA [Pseudomonadota bacterium]
MTNRIYLAALLVALIGATTQPLSADDKQFETQMQKYLATDAGQKAVGKSVEDYFKKKQSEAQEQQFEDQFKNRAKIDVGNSPSKGPSDAKITIVEFSDFQCPYCKRGMDTMEEVLKAYPKDVKLVFKHLPLPFHKEAMPAAKASYAAGKQGKFWEMHDALFINQDKLTADFYVEQAKTLGLNVDQFKKDMGSPEAEAAVKADKEIAEKNGIQGTPAFFVNGVGVRGAYPLDHFKKVIERLMNEKKA